MKFRPIWTAIGVNVVRQTAGILSVSGESREDAITKANRHAKDIGFPLTIEAFNIMSPDGDHYEAVRKWLLSLGYDKNSVRGALVAIGTDLLLVFSDFLGEEQ